VFVAVDHGGAQRRTRLGLGPEVDLGQCVLRGDGLGRPDGQPGSAQQAREVQHVDCQRRASEG
jgi:hypothetical protein